MTVFVFTFIEIFYLRGGGLAWKKLMNQKDFAIEAETTHFKRKSK